jgi:aspartyl-tRNA(Asn)/glutamyl-tRNA(Gln) amidotransferase subunit B
MGQAEFGTRTELKNLNSFKHVEKAIAHEIQRQTYVLNEGKSVAQETRLWDPDKNKTVSMRGKEEAHDYRYFPDPDLTPLIVDDTWIKTIEKELPELPDEKFSRFVKQYALSDADAGVLTSSIALADFFEQVAAPLKNKKQAANWVLGTVLAMLNTKAISIAESPVSAQAVGKLLVLVETQKINASAAKTVFDLMVETLKDPALIVQENGLEQVSDASELESAVMAVINENPEETTAYRGGKTKLFSFFMGQVMKKTKGKADPKIVTPLLKTKLM